MGKEYIKEIIEEYLQNRYPEETEDLIRSWLTDEENRQEKYEALSEHWDKLQVEPDIFIYDSLEQVKERIRQLPELLDEPEHEPVPDPVEPSVVTPPVAEEIKAVSVVAEVTPDKQPEATIDIKNTEESHPVVPPVIQLSSAEIIENHIYEMPVETTVISIRNEKDTDTGQEQENPRVIQLKDAEKEEKEQSQPVVAPATPAAQQPSNPWIRQEEEPDDLPKPSIAWWKVAAVVIPFFLMAGSAAYMYFSSRMPLEKTFMAILDYGENRELILSDGSTVWLKGGSTLSYPDKFVGKERVVELNGEGFFSIRKDAQHPFKVKTASSLEVYVTGTEFNLSAYSEEEQVIATLISGSIRVDLPAEEIYTLQPSQQLTYDKRTTETVIRTLEMNADADWKEGQFFFYNATLPDILQSLYRRIDIEFRTPPSFMEQTETYTIKFVNGEDIDDIMTVLQELVGFSWSREGSVIEIK